MTMVISVENLSKSYRLGQIGTGTLTNDLKVWWARRRGRTNPLLKIGQNDQSRQNDETVWALQDVSFTVQQGEVLGIIGKNGAGKSTLLKILSRITAPTSGQIKVKGRIASLLEVGTGFHPELTGRENIYLNGAILGMSRREIDRKFGEIVDFAEIEKFIDTPVKRYSSGMYVRLAFAVAAHLDPEILVVDEVLAVGDATFQKKCLGKMGEVAKEGRTVLFVSHNMTAVKSLCHNGMLLHNGNVFYLGEISRTVNAYLSINRREIIEQNWDSRESAPGNSLVRVRRVKLVPIAGTENSFLTVNTQIQVSFELWILQPATLNISMHLSLISGDVIFASPSPSIDCKSGLVQFTCNIPGELLNDGIYSLLMMVVKDSSKVIYKMDNAVVFEIHDSERIGHWLGKWPGAVRPKLEWLTCNMDDNKDS